MSGKHEEWGKIEVNCGEFMMGSARGITQGKNPRP